eukprot:CAMPEP_0176038996 /NCGR_PEP_ID=MMETSP0120_2-20121206/19329_1 /TAXON_ID=160619 /ORGANISM="Kryptoperidinium foliaceum, Strain CCMP 1326" /LENGTH=133 /DNA_ID=CAMNT_0017372391 /DNA_START=33 /DNA_END=434 /DNA_ORIENTATION=+
MPCFSYYRVPPKRGNTYGSEVRTLWHITAYGQEIKDARRMERGSQGMVGAGIYFADSLADCRQKAHSTGWKVRASVFLGKRKNIAKSEIKNYSFRRLQQEGYDSLCVTDCVTGPEYIVFNRDQVQLLQVERDQ